MFLFSIPSTYTFFDHRDYNVFLLQHGDTGSRLILCLALFINLPHSGVEHKRRKHILTLIGLNPDYLLGKFRQRLKHSSRAHACGEKLLMSWVRTLLGTWLFSSHLYHISSASLIQVPYRGATLLGFL